MNRTDGHRIQRQPGEALDTMRRSSPASSWPLDALATTLLGGQETGGRLALIHSVERRGREPPRHTHTHRNEDEVVYVLDGELTYYLGNKEVQVGTGSSLFLSRGAEHCYRVISGEAHLLVILMPAGLESYYQALAELSVELGIERLVTIAARYGIEITGPPIGATTGETGTGSVNREPAWCQTQP
ncbi:MAG TPA: cupin domain-containing protein [Chloroflexota bacterium]|nr:cupin domain-containing protein [Chloroflexota bacterium]